MDLRIALVTVVGLTACGGTSPGSGTKTLYVNARLSTDGSTDGTRARVQVRAGSATGAPVTDAQVKLRGSKLEQRTLSANGNSGDYDTGNFAWDDVFLLEVVRGSDALEAALEAPGVTVITAPIASTTFRRADGAPLKIQWKDEKGRRADIANLEFDKANVSDSWANDSEPFQVEIEANRLVAEDKERIDLERSNEVSLAGGTAGSLMRATTSHRVEFTVE